jgi:hypothetical protein
MTDSPFLPHDRIALRMIVEAALAGLPAPPDAAIAAAMGMSSPSSSSASIARMVRCGLIRVDRLGGSLRVIHVVEYGIATADPSAPPPAPEPAPRPDPPPTASDATLRGPIPDYGTGLSRPWQRPAVRALLAALDARGCVWMDGDPRDADPRICGRRAAPGRPYCPHHARRSVQRQHRADVPADAAD